MGPLVGPLAVPSVGQLAEPGVLSCDTQADIRQHDRTESEQTRAETQGLEEQHTWCGRAWLCTGVCSRSRRLLLKLALGTAHIQTSVEFSQIGAERDNRYPVTGPPSSEGERKKMRAPLNE